MKKAIIIGNVIILFVFAGIRLNGQELRQLLPSVEDLPGWKLNQQPAVYNGDGLFELIDGGADIYLEYGFTRVVSAQYADPSQNIILIEIYEMNDSAAAYGIFSLSQGKTGWKKAYGTDAAETADYISFWKSRYYVIVSWLSRQTRDTEIFTKVAGVIAGKIVPGSDYPPIVTSYGLALHAGNTIYFRGNLGLSNFYYIDYKDVFQINEGIAASADGVYKVVIAYDDPEKATEVMQSAKQSFSSNKRFSDVAAAYQGFRCRDNKGNIILARQTGSYVILLISADKDNTMTAEMDAISQVIENSNK